MIHEQETKEKDNKNLITLCAFKLDEGKSLRQ